MRIRLQTFTDWLIPLVLCLLGAVGIVKGMWEHSWLWGLAGFFVGTTGAGLISYVLDHPPILTLSNTDFTFAGDFRHVSVRWEDLQAIETKTISYGKGSTNLLIIRWTDGGRERKWEVSFGLFLTLDVARTLRRWWQDPAWRKQQTTRTEEGGCTCKS